ncbi:unnamed protein product, partial [Adineta steineri]
MPHRMRKIVSRCRPPFIRRRHKRYTVDITHDCPNNNIDNNSNSNTTDNVYSTDDWGPHVISSPQLAVNSTNNDLDNQSVSSTPTNSAIFKTMQNTASSSNLSTIGTGIVPPAMHTQQSQYMQSTTPLAVNGKDEIRGWLYKWTNYLKGYQKRWFVLQS